MWIILKTLINNISHVTQLFFYHTRNVFYGLFSPLQRPINAGEREKQMKTCVIFIFSFKWHRDRDRTCKFFLDRPDLFAASL